MRIYFWYNETAASVNKLLLGESAAEDYATQEIRLSTGMDNYGIDCMYILYD